MSRTGRIFLSAALCCALAAGIDQALPATGCGFTLLSSDESRVTIRFELPDWELEGVDLGGSAFSRINARCGEQMLKAGYPVLPSYKTLVALPPGSAISSSFSSAAPARVNAGRLLPAQPEGKISADEFGTPERATEYSRELLAEKIYPAGKLVVSAPKRFRDLTLAEVTVMPFSYEPSTGTLQVTESMEVTINISARTSGEFNRPQSSAEPVFESLYRGNVLNYSSSLRWRLPAAGGARPAAAGPFAGSEQWARIQVSQSDMYAVSGQKLEDAGADLKAIDPRTLRLYSGGNRMLNEDPAAQKPLLAELAVYVEGAADGSFDPQDKLIFFGEGVDRFTVTAAGAISSIRNRYANNAVYWLTWGGGTIGRRMEQLPAAPQPVQPPALSAEVWYHFEDNTQYLALDTGADNFYNPAPDYWAWVLDSDKSGTAERGFDLARPPAAEQNFLRIEIYGNDSGNNRTYSIQLNGVNVVSGSNLPFSTAISPWLTVGAGLLSAEGNRFTLNGLGQALGYFELRVYTPLTLSQGERLLFHETKAPVNPSYEFSTGGGGSVRVFDLTVPEAPALLQTTVTATGGFRFNAPVSAYRVRTFAAVAGEAYHEPESLTLGLPEDLRSLSGAAYLVVSPRALLPQAGKLAALHAGKYSTAVVAIEDVYNNFSFGPADPAALRDFLQYAFESWSIRPQFVVLFGDGNNDFRGVTVQGRAKANYILPYITKEDIAVEEWFARFGDSDLPQVSLGRIPVQNAAEAEVAVDKNARYEAGAEAGDWVRRLILVADDGYTLGNECDLVTNHVPGSEKLDSLFPADFMRRKIYLDEYPFDPPGIGTRKPAANEDLLAWWNRGALLINYLGHGSNLTWAQERVFDTERDIALLNNGYRLPLVLNSSCSIGHFDDYREQAMAERLVSLKGGGAVAVFAGTRVTYAFQNFELNRLFVQNLFGSGPVPIGAAQLAARLNLGGLDRGNAERYAIFGDPALILHSPGRMIKIEQDPAARLQAGAKVDFTGRIEDETGKRDPGFSGVAQIKFSTSGRPVDISYQCRLGNSLLERNISFERTPAVLFDGPVTISGGAFQGSFVLPADLAGSLPADSLQLGSGRFLGYATSDKSDASGGSESSPFLPGGQISGDTTAPSIRIYSQGRALADGDRISRSQSLELVVSDDNGINTTGRPGEQLTVEVDDGLSWSADLTPLFSYRKDSYQEGTVGVDLGRVEEGLHSFRFRATDNALNTARVELMLYLSASAGRLALSNVVNYPNPFRDQTEICFEVSQPAEVLIRIFSVAGRPVRELRTGALTAGFHSATWDGRDEYRQRIANGVYLYKIICKSMDTASNSGLEEVEAVGKALLSR